MSQSLYSVVQVLGAGSHSKKVNRVLLVRRRRRRFSSSCFRLSYEPRSCREYKIPLTARLGVLSGSIPVEFFTGRHNKPSKFCELGDRCVFPSDPWFCFGFNSCVLPAT